MVSGPHSHASSYAGRGMRERSYCRHGSYAHPVQVSALFGCGQLRSQYPHRSRLITDDVVAILNAQRSIDVRSGHGQARPAGQGMFGSGVPAPCVTLSTALNRNH
jgi:hypothetical protein